MPAAERILQGATTSHSIPVDAYQCAQDYYRACEELMELCGHALYSRDAGVLDAQCNSSLSDPMDFLVRQGLAEYVEKRGRCSTYRLLRDKLPKEAPDDKG